MILCVSALLFAIEKQIFTTNKHVTVEMRAPENISQTQDNEISFFLDPIDGIHINTNPKFELILDKKSTIEVIGKPSFQKNENGYLDTQAAIKFSVKPKASTKTGKQTLKGKLNYFYCSDKEGWCNRFSQPFEASITVTK